MLLFNYPYMHDYKTFSEILHVLTTTKQKAARKGWHGAGMFIFLVPGSTFAVNRPPLLGIFPEGYQINYKPHLDICLPDGSIAVWTPSQVDILAEDWEIVTK